MNVKIIFTDGESMLIPNAEAVWTGDGFLFVRTIPPNPMLHYFPGTAVKRVERFL